MSRNDRLSFDPTFVSFAGMTLGQLAMIVFGVLVVSNEYSTGMIRTSLAAVPQRGTLLFSKIAVATGLTLVLLYFPSALMIDGYPVPAAATTCTRDCPPNAFQLLGHEPAFVADVFAPLRETVTVVIDNDLPAVEKVTFETLQKVKRLLMIISERVPFEPNMSELWKQLNTNNELGLRMLYALDKAQILGLLTAKAKNYKYLLKPDKIFLGNTNLMHVLCSQVDKGNKRETFFYSQLIVKNQAKYPPKGGFLIDDKYLFEVGGKGKTFEQIANMPNSFLAVDDTEVGHGSRIPLWMFGLLY
jgi:hypothetical protein